METSLLGIFQIIGMVAITTVIVMTFWKGDDFDSKYNDLDKRISKESRRAKSKSRLKVVKGSKLRVERRERDRKKNV